MNTETDEQLMARVASGNTEVLSILFDRYHVYLYNFLLKLTGDRFLSEEVTQEVFEKILKYRESYANGNFRAWLFTIARNHLKGVYTAVRYRNYEDLELYSHSLQAETDETDDHSHLHAALARLDPEERELLVLNRLQRIRYAELAPMLGITEGAVKTRVNRALQKLRDQFFKTL